MGPAADDRSLLAGYASGRDEEAFAALVRRHGPLVWGVCRRALRHTQDAEDCFQATFLVLARRAGSVRWHESVTNCADRQGSATSPLTASTASAVHPSLPPSRIDSTRPTGTSSTFTAACGTRSSRSANCAVTRYG